MFRYRKEILTSTKAEATFVGFGMILFWEA